MEHTFGKILEIKTGRKEHLFKAVYLKNTNALGEGNYYIYYYDIFTHSFYIDDIHKVINNTRTSAINIL